MASWAEIKDDVEKNGNIKTVTMEELRDAQGAAKLGGCMSEMTSAVRLLEWDSGMFLKNYPLGSMNWSACSRMVHQSAI